MIYLIIKMIHVIIVYVLNPIGFNNFFNKNTVKRIAKIKKLNLIFIYCIIITFFMELHLFILITNNYNKYNTKKYSQFLTLLIHPFYTPIFEMSIYFMNKINIDEKYLSKLFWNNYYSFFKINTPNLVGFVINGVSTNFKNGNYIIKPIYGTYGIGVEKYNYNKQYVGVNIVQKRIYSTYNGENKNCHYRIVTDKNGNLINTYLMYGDNIATNQKQKSKFINPEYNNNNLKIAIDKAKEINIELPNFNYLGHDVMIDNENYWFLETNIYPSIIYEKDLNYFEKIKEGWKKIKKS